jgi:hypothetical protein
MYPPHVPPPASSLSTYRTWQRLKVIFGVTFLGLFAGATAACMILGWLGPHLTGGTTILSYYRADATPRDSSPLLSSDVEDSLATKLVSVYRQKMVQPGGITYFDPHDRVGQGVVLSSDGWLAVPALQPPERNSVWYVLTTSGSFVSTTQVLYSPDQGLAYLKVAVNRSLRPIEFNQQVTLGDSVFTLSDTRPQAGIIDQFKGFAEALLTTGIAPRFQVSSARPGVAVDISGRLVGILNNQGSLVESSVVAATLPAIFKGRVPATASLGVSGWFTEDIPFFNHQTKAAGFLVTNFTGKNLPFKKGDILTDLQGIIVRRGVLWYTESTSSVHARLFRAGKQIEFSAKIFPL